jgi:hypothetical protein
MARELIGLDHFSGGRNVTPTPDDSVDDLAKLLREQQQDVKARKTLVAGDSPYDILLSEVIVGVDTGAGAVTVNLPLANSVPEGKTVIIQDEGNNAGTNAITIAASGTDTLVGVASIAADDGRASAYSNGVDTWYCA